MFTNTVLKYAQYPEQKFLRLKACWKMCKN